MINDAALRVSTNQAVTTTAVSVDSIDLTSIRDVGQGQSLTALFTVGTAFAGGTSTEFQVVLSAAGALTSPVVIGSSGPIPTAQLIAGRQIPVHFNPRPVGLAGLRFAGAQYVVVGTNTAGTVICDVVDDVQDGRTFTGGGFSVL